MSFWPFRKRTPEPPKAPPRDCRVWNEDWRVGDIAECVVNFDGWHELVKPWNKPARGARFVVAGFREGKARDGCLHYALILEGWPVALSTIAFRKVRPVAVEESEIAKRILNAKPGADNPRVEA